MSFTIHLRDLATGDMRRHEFPHGRRITLGRDATCDVVIPDGRISRKHLELHGDRATPELQDLSRNGTLYRTDAGWDRMPTPQPVGLELTLKLGDTLVRIERSAPPEGAPAETTWDESVIIPADALATQREAILVFDLCASSAMANKDDLMAYHLKQRLTQLAEPVLEDAGRRFFKSTGDGFLACLPDPAQAMAAAVELEHRIQQRNARSSNPPIGYRIALHFGNTWLIASGGEDVHGNDVNITFRIEGVQADAFETLDQPLPAQDRILCSEAFLAAVPEAQRSPLCTAGYCGKARLKGIAEPLAIHLLSTAYTA